MFTTEITNTNFNQWRNSPRPNFHLIAVQKNETVIIYLPLSRQPFETHPGSGQVYAR